jgi:hypothetical protein
MSIQKETIERLMIDSGCDPRAWFKAACHVADINNRTAHKGLNYRTPLEVRDGYTPDISSLIQHKFWDDVYYMEYEHDFPSEGGNEKKGKWLGRALEYGDKMCYWILTDDTHQIIVRSMVRSAVDTERPNRGVPEFLHEDEEKLEKIFPIIRKKDELPRAPILKGSTRGAEIHPEDLIDLYIMDTFKGKTGKTKEVKGQIKEQVNDREFRVTFEDGKQRIYEYEELMDKINKDDDDDEER